MNEVKYESEKITVEIPKGAMAVSIVTTYVNGGRFGMATKIYDTNDLEKLRKEEEDFSLKDIIPD